MRVRVKVNLVGRTLLLVVVAGGAVAHADGRAELDQKVRTEYRGRTLVLRHFYSGDNLRYDRQGELRIGGPPGPWTVWGKIRITNTKVKPDSIVLEGDRLFLVYDEGRKEFRDVFSFDPKTEDVSQRFDRYDLHSERMQEFMKERLVRIEIDTKGLSQSESLAALNRVFLPESVLAEEVPSFWRGAVNRLNPTPGTKPPDVQPGDGEVVYKVGAGISGPRAKYQPDPEYSEPARKAGLRAGLALTIVVTPAGRVADVRIAKPAGMGLDEKAFEAVRTWEFEPARKDGKPVPVRVNVEITFRLY